jgi:hypothetical protein
MDSSAIGQFDCRSGEFTSPFGGVKPPLHQIDLLMIIDISSSKQGEA